MSLLKPSSAASVAFKQRSHKDYYHEISSNRPLVFGAQVLARSFGRGPTWLEGTLKRISGPSSFVVELEEGRSIRRHFDHILHRGK